MKIKFLRAFFIAMLCAIVFLATMFVPSVKSLRMADFLQGFSGGMGTVALLAAMYYCIELQKEKKLSNER